jgi:hypothetical protein
MVGLVDDAITGIFVLEELAFVRSGNHCTKRENE